MVYGVVAVAALMAAESASHDSYLETFASALIAVALYWLLHAYADVLGRRLSTRERLTARDIWRALIHEWAIVRGGAIPLAVMLICWAAGASRETAVTAALWSAVASLVLFELAAGVRSRASAGELALDVSIGATMGLAILAMRAVLLG